MLPAFCYLFVAVSHLAFTWLMLHLKASIGEERQGAGVTAVCKAVCFLDAGRENTFCASHLHDHIYPTVRLNKSLERSATDRDQGNS